jgi:hypothetical protein
MLMPVARFPVEGARSSVVEHTLHTGGVAGSTPAAITMTVWPLRIKSLAINCSHGERKNLD